MHDSPAAEGLEVGPRPQPDASITIGTPDGAIPPGTLVVLAHVASHLDLDLAWAFRDIGWELLLWGQDEERKFNAAICDIRPPGLVV
jgi:hypothetical protein